MAPTPMRNFRLPDAEWRNLQSAAQGEGITVSAMIRAAVRQYLKNHSPEEVKS